MLRVSLLNNRYDWSDATAAKDIQWINPTFIYLKDYYEYYSNYKDQIEWVIPIWQDSTVEEYADWIIKSELDVIGFGFYIWNAHIWFKVANLVRQKNPEILIIGGGPDIDFLDKDYAANLELSFDYIVKYDGEEPFRIILDNLVQGKPLTDIDQIYTIVNSTMVGKFSTTVNRRNNWFQENSPILNNKDILLEAFNEAHQRNQKVMMTWGTTRGCPYSCAFCDWGVSEYKKVGKRNPKLSKRELTFLALNKVTGIVLEDANWGMFKDDIDITIHWSRLYTRYKMLYRENLSHSKNNKDNVIKIIRIMAKSGMIPRYGAALQDLDEDVLKYNDRPDISWEGHQEVIKEISKVTKDTTMCYAMIITGMPGQTFNSIVETFCKLGESNLFDNYNVMPFLMLPGAPMNMPAHRKKYQVQHTVGHILEDQVLKNRIWNKTENFAIFPVKFLTSSFSFTSHQYLDMIFMSEFMRVFNIYFHSVFEKGIDRRYFYKNFESISNDIMGCFFTKATNYLKHHFDKGYYHLFFESKNYYMPIHYLVHIFLALHKKDIITYFKDFDIDVSSNFKGFCTHYGLPSIVFKYYTPEQSMSIMKELYTELQRY